MSIGSRIKELRIKHGWTQAQLAELVFMDRANVSNYERNRNKDVSTKVLRDFADAFGVNVEYLILGELSPEANEHGYLGKVDLSDKNTLEHVRLFMDGEILTKKELRYIIAFVRTLRGME